MITVKKEGIILKPSKHSFEAKGVFNPATVRVGNNVHMFYRALDQHNHSTIGYCKLQGPLKVVERRDKPFLAPEKRHERSYEDPRIVKLGDTYYMTYIIYDGVNVHISYASSKDLKTFKPEGIISPQITYDRAEDLFRSCQKKLKERYFLFESYFKEVVGKNVLLWDKDAILFPQKIKGKFALIHRILPDVQIIYFKDFKGLTLRYWERYFSKLCNYVVLESKHWFETRNVGGGCPPIETDYGWLFIYHAVDDMDRGKTYRAGAALLDKKNPTKVIAHLHHPLFSPEKSWEKKGNVENVVFPTGTALFGDRLYIYYGAADKYIAAVSVSLKKLLHELMTNPKNRSTR